MRKLILGLIIIMGCILSVAGLAGKKYDKMPKNLAQHKFKLTIKDVTSHKKGVSNDKCRWELNKNYVISATQKELPLNEKMKFKLKKMKIRIRKGLIKIYGKGIWSGTSPINNKKFTDRTYFRGQGKIADNLVKGTFHDSVCQGTFIGQMIQE